MTNKMAEPPESPSLSKEFPSTSSIQCAIYPVPPSFACIMEAAIGSDCNAQVCEAASIFQVEKETQEIAVAQLLKNAWSALDRMYFQTKSSIRQATWFAHRMCVRISIIPVHSIETQNQKGDTCQMFHNAISVTDCGVGMTRSDLINSLGIGRTSRRVNAIGRRLLGNRKISKDDTTCGLDCNEESSHQEVQSQVVSERIDCVEESVETSETEEDFHDDHEYENSDDVEDETDREDNDGNTSDECLESSDMMIIPCRETDIGGFFAAFCALGVGVTIGTKSKFDDYYEFSYGRTPENPNGSYTHFTIRRPMDEGVIPSVDTGYTSFSDVRGESGTRVTIFGTFDESQIRSIVMQHMATSHYRVAFAGDNLEEEASMIAASKVEQDAIKQLELDSNSSYKMEEDGVFDPDVRQSSVSVSERAKYIPLRLTLGERKMLRLVEATMTCCDYTSAVDDIGATGLKRARRTHIQLQGIVALLQGLVTACDYTSGQKLTMGDEELEKYQSFFQNLLEIARRHKIMNPEKMRTEYGKLIYLLQDAASPSVQPHLGLSIVQPIVTVYDFLNERGGISMLQDKLIEIATREVTGRRKTRPQIRAEIARKEKAVATLKAKYRTSHLSEEDIHLALYSIGDNDSFLNSNRVPIDTMIEYLQTYFSPNKVEEGYSLNILTGENGARLSHSHERQYYYALQSLTLWRDIIGDMFRLWYLAEEDLLSESVTYELQDTGQGWHRVQPSPRTYRAMQQIIYNLQHTKIYQWIGSSMVHMGDHNVPNALSFIDKYTQVPRILGPIVLCLENVEKMYEESQDITQFVDSNFGGLEKLRKDILHDFFRSAFDGSGADNFYDAGSCIDGRLTSAWNWCSQLPRKPYYCIFKLTGFQGFDGDFK